MLNKMSITWNAKQVVNMIKKSKCSFDNIIQRSYVWEKARKSDLIHSMIEGYPVPAFYTRRVAGGVYDFLDGKQRMNSIAGYLNDEYELTNVPLVTYEPMDSTEEVTIDISGLKFSELPEELQDVLNNYSLTIYYYENITNAQVATMFRKLNNGKPLSTKERNIANCIDIQNVTELGNHELFKSIVTSRGLETRKQLPLVMKIWCMLNQENVSFESKVFNQVMTETIITPEQNEELTAVLDKLLDVYCTIGENKERAEARLLKRKLCSETHLISFVPFVKKAIEHNIDTGMLVDFFAYFYGNENDSSISEIYNGTCKGGSAKVINVTRRNDELQAAWDEFFKKDDIELDTVGQSDTDNEDNNVSFTESVMADMENED